MSPQSIGLRGRDVLNREPPADNGTKPVGAPDSLIRSAAEGDLVLIRVKMTGPDDQDWPQMRLWVDHNSNGEPDALESMLVSAIKDADGKPIEYRFHVRIRDDGNDEDGGSSRDPLKMLFTWEHSKSNQSLAVENRPPILIQHPVLWTHNNEPAVSFRAVDPGEFDTAIAEVSWGDGVVSEYGPFNLPPTWVSASNIPAHAISRQAPVNGNSVYPVRVKVTDDDGGITEYSIDQVDVATNNNDDNGNGVPDRFEVSVPGDCTLGDRL